MSVDAIRAALETALKAVTPSFPTAWENVTFVPVAGTAYQAVDLFFAEPADDETGTTRYRQDGFMQVSLRYPLGAGAAPAQARAKLLRNAFPRGASLVAGGITTIVSSTPAIAKGLSDGAWWMVPVTVRFYAHVPG